MNGVLNLVKKCPLRDRCNRIPPAIRARDRHFCANEFSGRRSLDVSQSLSSCRSSLVYFCG